MTEWRYNSTSFYSWHLVEVNDQFQYSAVLPPGKNLRYQMDQWLRQ